MTHRPTKSEALASVQRRKERQAEQHAINERIMTMKKRRIPEKVIARMIGVPFTRVRKMGMPSPPPSAT